MVFLGPAAIITILLQGLLFGGILSMIAIGLTLIFGVSRVMNVAHGDFLVLGGMITTVLFTAFALNPFLSLFVVIPLFGGVGALFSFLMRRPISAGSAELSLAATVLVTLGLSNLIEGIGTTISSAFNYPFFTVARYNIGAENIFGVSLSNIFILSFITIIIISVAMTLLVYRTSFGGLMRASMQDREVAIMLGADTTRITIITFAIGISLAGLAGTIDVLITNIDPSVGLALTIDALTVVVLGGLGSFYGALIGGFTVGFVTSLVETILEELGQPGSEWGAAVPLVMLILILIVRPTGLLRR